MALELEERHRGHLRCTSPGGDRHLEGAARRGRCALYARALARLAPPTQDIDLLGPAPAPLYRLRGKFRQRLLVRAPRASTSRHGWLRWLALQKAARPACG